jgi:hypothetical protein
VSSASGDGSDGPGGTEPLPPPPEGPGELPRLDDGHSAVAEALLASIDSFSKQTQKVKDGKSFGWTWAVAPQTTTFESLASGALHLMLEMLDRLPQNGDVRAECQWLDDARTLGGAIADLGLWDAVLFNHGSLLRSKRYPPHWVGKYHLPESELAFALFACPAMPDDEQRFRHWWRAMHEFGWLLHEQQAAVDPGECVSRWPVPRFALGMMPSDMRDKASVEHLLAAFAGCPWSVRQLGSSARGVVDVVLFTCAYLVNWRQPATRNLGAYWLRPRHPSSMAIAAIERRGQAGMKWILEQLPSRGFSFGYEAVIERTRGIRYRDGSGGVLLSSKSAV